MSPRAYFRRSPGCLSWFGRGGLGGVVLLWGLFFGALLATPAGAKAEAAERELIFAVLAHRGEDAAREQWTPFAEYLEQTLEGIQVRLLPVDNDALQAGAAEDRFDLVLTNPGSYVMLEQRHGISRIATMLPAEVGREEDRFGAVIVAREGRVDLVELGDLVGQRISAVHPDAFGGWWMAWRELQAAGLDVEDDLDRVVFTGFPVSRGLDLLLAGEVDAATFRTGILEDLREQGDPRVEQVRLIGERAVPRFPYRTSTRLYPEWPLAMRGDLDAEIAQAVLRAILALDAEHPVSQAAGIAGWSAPRSYEDVQGLMYDLGVGLYAPEPFAVLRWARDNLAVLLAVLAAGIAAILLYVLRVHARMRIAGHNLRRAMCAIPNAVITLDARGGIVYMNPAAEQMAGLVRLQALGCTLEQVLDLREMGTDRPLGAERSEPLAANLGEHTEARLVTPSGQERIVRIDRTALDPVAGSSVRTLLVLADISEERELVDRLVHEASHDPLTGLLNRRAFEREMQRAMDNAREYSSVASLVLVDLDYFKAVNDRHGHQVGDELLRRVGTILRQLTRSRDAVARIGGDEFAVVAFDTDAEQARILGQRICSALGDRPLQVEARDVTIGASVGVVQLGAGLAGVDAAFVAADRACYSAKSEGRGQVGVARKADIHPITGS
ncbi:diguanylate cyclase with PAS/PAC sensor [Thioalkalivibrio sp. K90mix]|uniref:phosphate/phosphite/phosphonate ABC transporter substrate-binding protein n=1 Tax=Thioalkalivibrio sp. (strain K90mix) TaxID=396595 RepID=UPI000195A84F|nr:phosphate/phosphite/phosphonate ABC transporter substrate-binding protein [Thioalkalivibrio sp. K90mix]ADC70871.1 diguanylate cyclase with PAS/PAC sensor [Thioalkalivibrio sp. K90mix]